MGREGCGLNDGIFTGIGSYASCTAVYCYALPTYPSAITLRGVSIYLLDRGEARNEQHSRWVDG